MMILIAGGSCNLKKNRRQGNHQVDHLHGAINQKSNLPFDSNLISGFYQSYPELNRYRDDVTQVYRKHNYTHLWFDERGVIEFIG